MAAKKLNDSKVPGSSEESFSHLVEQKVSSLRRNIISERAEKIAEVVYRSVNVILEKVSELEPRFTVSEILKVGSYFEGTKIDQIDEFDFLVVIKELSKPGAIHINKEPDASFKGALYSGPGLVHIKLQDDDLKMKWGKYVVDDFLTCFQQASVDYKKHDLFGTFVLESIKQIAKSQHEFKHALYNPETDIEFYWGGLTLPSVRDSEQLILKSAEIKHPNTVLVLEYDGSVISVDLSPAIRYCPVEDCFEAGDCVDERLAKTVIDRGSILLVAKRGNAFRITFTETEVKYMRDKIHGVHKLIYMYLKYIKCLYAKMKPGFQPFSSYVLKMFCILHDINCTIENKIVSKCLDDVLDLMAEYCENEELPNVFNQRVTYLFISDTESEFRICMLDGLRKIKELAVANPTQAYFSKVIKDVVESSAKTVDPLRNRVSKEEEWRFRAEQRTRTANEPATSKVTARVPMLQVNNEVVRGPDWECLEKGFSPNNENGIGTVIGLRYNGWVNVRWRNGNRINYYRFGADDKYEVRQISATTNSATVTERMPILQVNDVVLRGPDWKRADQDGNGLGTVIQLRENGKVYVRWWNNDYKNVYRYGADNKYDVRPIIATTTTVVRGPDWKWADQDGNGPGTVIRLLKDGWVEVRWHNNGYVYSYRYGADNKYDVRPITATTTTTADTTANTATTSSEVRVVEQMPILQVNDGVLRGPDWKLTYPSKDRNGFGTVIGLLKDGWVAVRWHNDGYMAAYRYGADNKYDVRPIIATTTTVVRGPDWKSAEEDENGPGTVMRLLKDGWVAVRWHNAVAYFHNIYRYGADNKYDVQPIIATLTTVVRGPDWKSAEQDGNGPGTVMRLLGGGWVAVRWHNDGNIAAYRYGADNKFEVRPHTATITTTADTTANTATTSSEGLCNLS